MYTLICAVQDLALFGIFITGLVLLEWQIIVFPILIYILIPFLNELVYNCFAKLLFTIEKEKKRMEQRYSQSELENKYIENLPILYHPSYNITACGIEKLHPFDSVKYGRVFNILKEKGFLQEQGFYKPKEKVGRGLMLHLGMSPLYLLYLNYAAYVSKCIEIPLFFLPASFLRWKVLDPMMFSTQGSIDAAVLSLKRGWSINLSGGYHHACRQSGGGFCIYPDICFAIEYLRKCFGIKRCMIVDLDAHQGNGHERDFIDDKENTFILDFYNHSIYPADTFAAKGISLSKNVDFDTSDSEYISMLRKTLQKILDQFKPEFLLYNAGTDCLEGDRLGQMNLSQNCIIQRDQVVFEECLNRDIPLTMVLSGGYQQINAPVIADSILNLDQNLKIKNYNRKKLQNP
ncbi:histone deacetylase family protein (macronuclear) [Tetrahymena thermophila SB210]|uniref:Histone deacetylase family protein n=1 Tax=Tetrahymena thermophila (strain SB210) TaxID=312017 RepID=Q232Y2_TETTS|nr:histone deacetylase family protein [Tetrahymena thermophila SB210]EAR91698.2 histone deacetylase family protein [Tetrahymena thermophila SB210]|eukprot:XP_001011943.2 histone deacetylase family protein [Tetrahymena thermophila SB210]